MKWENKAGACVKTQSFHPSRTDASLTKISKWDDTMGSQLFLLRQIFFPFYFCTKILLHGCVLPGEGVQGPPKGQIPPAPGAPSRTKARGSFPWMLSPIHPRPQSSSGGTWGSPPWHQELFLPRESLAGCQNNKPAGNGGPWAAPTRFPRFWWRFRAACGPGAAGRRLQEMLTEGKGKKLGNLSSQTRTRAYCFLPLRRGWDGGLPSFW